MKVERTREKKIWKNGKNTPEQQKNRTYEYRTGVQIRSKELKQRKNGTEGQNRSTYQKYLTEVQSIITEQEFKTEQQIKSTEQKTELTKKCYEN